ncbi:unnamed protein product [Sphacelaria rigidula]
MTCFPTGIYMSEYVCIDCSLRTTRLWVVGEKLESNVSRCTKLSPRPPPVIRSYVCVCYFLCSSRNDSFESFQGPTPENGVTFCALVRWRELVTCTFLFTWF